MAAAARVLDHAGRRAAYVHAGSDLKGREGPGGLRSWVGGGAIEELSFLAT